MNVPKAVTDYLKAIGRKGGAVKSAAKTEAARANGAKGGRGNKRQCQVDYSGFTCTLPKGHDGPHMQIESAKGEKQ